LSRRRSRSGRKITSSALPRPGNRDQVPANPGSASWDSTAGGNQDRHGDHVGYSVEHAAEEGRFRSPGEAAREGSLQYIAPNDARQAQVGEEAGAITQRRVGEAEV
jgi:hypothetical protein